MRRFISIFFIILSFVGFASARSDARDDVEFYRARVVEVLAEGTQDAAGFEQPYQRLEVEILSGSEKGKKLKVEYGGVNSINEDQKMKKGDDVVLSKAEVMGSSVYGVNDKYRLTPLLWIALVFLAVAIIFGRIKGFTSVIGMIFSLLFLIKFTIPQILDGKDPLTMCLLAAFFIGIVSIYLAHGFNKRTTIALGSTVITLGIAAFLAIWAVAFAKLSGASSEEVWFLQLEGLENLDPRGLLLGGMIIGILGILDDITTAQVAVVDELHQANPGFSVSHLYKKGLSVGQEHIAALINTLVLAYAGVSLPLLLLFALDQHEPWWVTLNSEFLAEEVVRTLVGSMALVFAVPISTFLAAAFYKRKKS
ncbi:MAG: YibE/F family protein [Patescibacteria group bacterium]